MDLAELFSLFPFYPYRRPVACADLRAAKIRVIGWKVKSKKSLVLLYSSLLSLL